MRFLIVVLFFCIVCLFPSASAAFGYTNSSTFYSINSGAGLVFRVNKENGNIIHILYNSTQLQDFTRFSHINSGLWSTNVSIDLISSSYVKVTIAMPGLTHYLIVKEGENNIYMGTYITAEPSVGELRFIARLNRGSLPNCDVASDIINSDVIEGEDVFKLHGVNGTGVGAYMVIPGVGYESSSGGPFFRDIDHQGITTIQEVYFYMNSGHAQTESYRMGFHGPYLLSFTNGPPPSGDVDTSFYEYLDLSGYIPLSGRGFVKGTTSGIDSAFPVVVGFKNSDAQYWTRCSTSDGSYISPPMKPGNYTITLFKSELEVQTDYVVVEVGKNITKDLVNAEFTTNNTIFQIGEFDGTPKGFMNADKIERAHPSDKIMTPWVKKNYTVGEDLYNFPMALFMRGLNNPITILFNLTYVPRASGSILRVGITIALQGGRPQATVNGWTAKDQGASSQPDSRGSTRGTWRGNNKVYSFTIPSGTLVNGSNTIIISVISGSSGDDYLSPSFVFDAVQLYGIATLSPSNIPTNPPTNPPTDAPTETPSATSSSSASPSLSSSTTANALSSSASFVPFSFVLLVIILIVAL